MIIIIDKIFSDFDFYFLYLFIYIYFLLFFLNNY